jgi:hypothetical protein
MRYSNADVENQTTNERYCEMVIAVSTGIHLKSQK